MSLATVGQLRRRLELQAPTDTLDAYGQATRTWATYATVWSKIEVQGGSEVTVADQQQQERTHKLTIRYWPGVVSGHRALYAGRAFNFTSVVNVDEQGRWLIIMATERMTANG